MTGKKILEYVKSIGIAILIALFIRAYIVQAFKIPSGSMIPTLLIGDHLLVNKFIYGVNPPLSDEKILVFETPKRGDIIVFKYPEDPSRDFIKRVIGVEGDTVEIKNKKVFVNGIELKEPYARHTDSYIHPRELDPRDNFGPIKVPPHKLFVMGDNRDQSYDSRFWGFVDLKDVKGKAFIIYWSWDNDNHKPRLQRIGKLIK
ncbi:MULTISPECIES: signal peptidase I [Thermodesulfovibrio]|uniref:Signal peptidase I n=2 Tax=Thermodesulfovibrio yellowstonii TaxID=28262 RepID=B5YHC8_THEYD|nr:MULTISPECIES: signal peptidase I [Thermodesulfovibrio]ACI21080.1 signal peptidase I [Thermodesulfovibrio yellowstonii DSM 11347]MBC7189870.1 signal peptidase I [Candidatus Aerophobetes bacterium]MDI6865461.1 signal peptidase I [Thermodesulfovibrio yellowstonii]GLI52635.1 signal peptidase I [Thermodesulfovibrio islandicus]